MNVSMPGSYPALRHTGGFRLAAADPPEPPFAVAEQFELVGVMLLDGGAVAHADQDGVRQLGAHQLVEQELQAFIERGRGLVEEHHLGLGEQDAGERDALLLAGGEHLGPVQHLVEPVDDMRQRHLRQGARRVSSSMLPSLPG